MRLHFIAIGGAAMHNLALALSQKGYQISGSDDEIYNPSLSRLKKAGLLPEKMGWDDTRITRELDAIILGMHARQDNPELKKALETGIPVYSYPEYIYKESIDKKRVVIAGSHGKTTTTSMVMFALRQAGVNHDYLVGAQLKGYDRMVELSDAELIILEGDEYLSSPLDRRPKILHYHPHIAVITGIAWDHINVFPTYEEYVLQFELFLQSISSNGVVIYNEEDMALVDLINKNERKDLTFIPYNTLSLDRQNRINFENEVYTSPLIGKHNYQNMAGAMVCSKVLGMEESDFLKSMETFTGPAKRLQCLHMDDQTLIYLDFAHAPSKVNATVKAVKEWYIDKRVTAVLELHTFSSLNKEFLPQYRGALDMADEALVYYNDHTLQMKGMPALPSDDIKGYFGRKDLLVVNKKSSLQQKLIETSYEDTVFLCMTSGNFSGINLTEAILQ